MEQLNYACIACKKTVQFLRRKNIKQIRILSLEVATSVSNSLDGSDVPLNSIICEKCRMKFNNQKSTIKPSHTDVSQSKQQKLQSDETPPCSNYSPTIVKTIPEEVNKIEEQPSTSYTCYSQLQGRNPPTDECMDTDIISFDSNEQSFSSEAVTSEASVFPSPKKPKERPEIETVELPFSRTIISHRYCFLCGNVKKDLVVVPFKARLEAFREKRIYIPMDNRCCSLHLFNKKRFYADQLESLKPYSTTCKIPTSEIAQYLDVLCAKSHSTLFDQFRDRLMPEERLRALTGFSWENLEKIQNMLTSMRNTSSRDVIQALIVFLFKIRTGSSNNITSAILGISCQQTIARYFDSVLNAFQTDILPQQFGPMAPAITRDFLINERSSQIANELFGIGNKLALICDGTYLSHEKSRNNSYQRRSYSGQKKKHLCKPFTVCTTDGFVVDVGGPYLGTMNDASILKDMLSKPNGIKKLLQPGDYFILDRGFRDAIAFLEEAGYRILTPAFKDKKKQLGTEESNNSRFVTKIRWVVEVIHGIVSQKYKFLHGQVDNKMLVKVGTITKIVCHLNNLFSKKLTSDEGKTAEIVQRMKSRMATVNEFAQEVEDERWERKRKCFQPLSSSEVLDFPQLTEDQLTLFFTGSYQLGQAISYLGELMNPEDSTVGLCQVTNIKPHKILRVEIQSRHRNNASYKCFIKYQPNDNCMEGILGYACQCANGLRTVGSCSHIAAIIFYLSNARYKSRIIRPNEILTNLFKPECGVDVMTGAQSDDED